MATGTSAVQTIDVVTPAAGESVTEGTILEWRVEVGDPIKLDDTIVEISTDKVDVELPSPGSGFVSEILVQEGETVTVGQVIARISVNGSAPPRASDPAPEGEREEHPAAAQPAAQASRAPDALEPAERDASPRSNGSAARTVDVLTPAAGESVTEGTILEWRVKLGDAIKLDETIVEISTDKVDLELPSPATGTVSEILVAEGDTVTVGQLIARISVNGAVSARQPASEGAPAAATRTDQAASAAPGAPAGAPPPGA
ncbi:MAG: biotin/lipoyl-containing protein, partial [Solirubrobacteraceae bacterium]